MKDWKTLENVLDAALRRYEEMFNQVNKDYEVLFLTTITNQKVEVDGMSKWVAYMRLERQIKPKGGTDAEAERLLIYNQAYKFQSTQERLNPESPWKFDLYEDALNRLIAGGLEYGEVLKRLKRISETAPEVAQSHGIEITKEMPKPLTPDEEKYKQWVQHNRQKQ